MTYEQWKTLSEEQKIQVPEAEYPQIPKEQLENGLTESRLEMKDGQLGWTIVQKVGDQEADPVAEPRIRTAGNRDVHLRVAAAFQLFQPLKGEDPVFPGGYRFRHPAARVLFEGVPGDPVRSAHREIPEQRGDL